MTFKEGLIRARSHLVFVAGLLVATGLVLLLESWERNEWRSVAMEGDVPEMPEPAPLTEPETEWAAAAWHFFESNTSPETGLVGGRPGKAETDLWQTGSYLMAVVSAGRLGIASPQAVDQRLGRALGSLKRLTDAGVLPGRFDAGTLGSTGDDDSVSGVGLARLVVGLHTVAGHYPRYAASVRAILASLPYDRAIRNGQVVGNVHGVLLPEARLGEAVYAARALALAGLHAPESATMPRRTRKARVQGVDLLIDPKDPAPMVARLRENVAFALEGLEFGWDPPAARMAAAVLAAQQARSRHAGRPTAVADLVLDAEPEFVWTLPFLDGRAWTCLAPDGTRHSDALVFSTAAAFAQDALFRTPHTRQMRNAAAELYDHEKGWFAGRYDDSGEPNRAVTCFTNATVLESLCYKAFGRLVPRY